MEFVPLVTASKIEKQREMFEALVAHFTTSGFTVQEGPIPEKAQELTVTFFARKETQAEPSQSTPPPTSPSQCSPSQSPRTDSDFGKFYIDLSIVDGASTIIDTLLEEAQNGDLEAAKVLRETACDTLSQVFTGVSGLTFRFDETVRVFDGNIGPSIRVEIDIETTTAGKRMLEGLEYFASYWRQRKLHVCRCDELLNIGSKHDDGSYVTPAFVFKVNGDPVAGELAMLRQNSGICCLTYSPKSKTIETCFAGDIDDQVAVREYEDRAAKLGEALASAGFDGALGRKAIRIWTYGEGGIPFERIRGDFPAPKGNRARPEWMEPAQKEVPSGLDTQGFKPLSQPASQSSMERPLALVLAEEFHARLAASGRLVEGEASPSSGLQVHFPPNRRTEQPPQEQREAPPELATQGSKPPPVTRGNKPDPLAHLTKEQLERLFDALM